MYWGRQVSLPFGVECVAKSVFSQCENIPVVASCREAGNGACGKLVDKAPTSFLNFSAIIQHLKGKECSPTAGTLLISDVSLERHTESF